MERLENPMVVDEITTLFELHEVHECNWCGNEMQDENEVYSDHEETLCRECLLDKYRLA